MAFQLDKLKPSLAEDGLKMCRDTEGSRNPSKQAFSDYGQLCYEMAALEL